MDKNIIIARITKGIINWLQKEKGIIIDINTIANIVEDNWEPKPQTPKWLVTVMYNEGYGKQCVDLEPFEAENKEDALLMGKELAEVYFANKINVDVNNVTWLEKWEMVDIIDIKVKKVLEVSY